MSRIEWLTHDHFAGRIGERFYAADIPLELVETKQSTEPGGRGPEGQERLQFSLVFRGPVEPRMPQAIYPLAHDDFDGLELFLVPIGADSGGVRYQAAFA